MKDELQEISEQLEKIAERLRQILQERVKGEVKANDSTVPEDPGDHHPH